MSSYILAWSFTLGQSLTELDAIISPLLIQCSPFASHECQGGKVAETYVIYFRCIHSVFQPSIILFCRICPVGFPDDMTAHVLTFFSLLPLYLGQIQIFWLKGHSIFQLLLPRYATCRFWQAARPAFIRRRLCRLAAPASLSIGISFLLHVEDCICRVSQIFTMNERCEKEWYAPARYAEAWTLVTVGTPAKASAVSCSAHWGPLPVFWHQGALCNERRHC